MSKTCPSCGYDNPDTANFCTRCGASLGNAGVQWPTNYTLNQPVQAYPTVPPPATQPPQPSQKYTQADVEGLRKIRSYALLGLVGIVLSLVSLFFSALRSFVVINTARPQNHPIPFSGTTVAVGAVVEGFIVGVLGVVIAILAFVFLYQGFMLIAQVDLSLRTPARLLLLMPIGLLILIFAAGLIVASLATTPTQFANPQNTGLVIGGALLGLLSLILVLVGIVGGGILGLWRVGARYAEPLIQIGGILSIIPVLNILTPILVYLGASAALAKVRNGMKTVTSNNPPPTSQ
ncbi:hypothetical protein B9Q04_18740 [Candidatus Marsarchaeota G2 archaeon BE_D]|jgi:hypothetical protein|uniref:Zinc-ribbon domain-containing protein n=1 Tax=Candidatus Marsarchaeota G2 archaeon BE_D TaxID=1978158 RepID=A0A2R6C4R7_9ARCH|nr:MAG: hypothetical protein B9Q04_18740 [Candidatus Marsarchaeota G2 archaeon BE_D]